MISFSMRLFLLKKFILFICSVDTSLELLPVPSSNQITSTISARIQLHNSDSHENCLNVHSIDIYNDMKNG